MPMHTAYVRQVLPGKGGRFEVWLVNGPMVYTFDQRRAALCERAGVIHRAVTIGTQQTQWGHQIVTVELVAEESKAS